MDVLLKKTARVLFGIPFIVFGINHFFNAGMLAGMVPGFVPGGVFWVYVTGAVLVLTGLSLIVNKYTAIGGYMLAGLLAIFVLTIHLPGMFNNPMQSMSGFLKDLSLMAAALYFATKASEQEVV